MSWKAKLKDISQVDSGGFVEANFEIWDTTDAELEDTLIYPNCRTYCHPDEVKDRMKATIKSLKQQIKDREDLLNTI